jgi:transposase
MLIFQILRDKEWKILETLLPQEPIKRVRGMPHTDFRKVLNTIFWVLLTGAPWKTVPKDPAFAPKSTAHRWLQRWKKDGVIDKMLIHLLKKAQDEGLTDCHRLIVDGSFSPCENGGRKS